MGDIAEYYRDLQIDDEVLSWNADKVEESNLKGGYWRTVTGDLIPIAEMTEAHKNNCIKMIEEKRIDLHFPDEWIKKFKKSQK